MLLTISTTGIFFRCFTHFCSDLARSGSIGCSSFLLCWRVYFFFSGFYLPRCNYFGFMQSLSSGIAFTNETPKERNKNCTRIFFKPIKYSKRTSTWLMFWYIHKARTSRRLWLSHIYLHRFVEKYIYFYISIPFFGYSQTKYW